jgi:RsiW-degrading membrane proteinase PrsW (M82 family)
VLATKLSGHTTPVSRGELICLVRKRDRGRWQLLWTISEDGEAEAEAVRSKIKSKMNTAAALGTVIVGLTTFLLQEAFKKEPSLWHWLAFAALGGAAALYFVTLFLYDTLQMPPRFWGSRFPSRTASRKEKREMPWSRFRHGRSSVRRPPSSTARVLQANMVQIWTWIFTPATILAGLGVALFAIGATSMGREDIVNVQPWHVLVVIAGLAILIVAWVAWQRPNLGTSD